MSFIQVKKLGHKFNIKDKDGCEGYGFYCP